MALFNMNSGYNGYSMSNRAVEAYESGEAPMSKWTKAKILDAIADIDEEKAEKLKKVKVKILRAHFLEYSSWHHTSSYANATDFYSLDEGAVESLEEEDIKALLDESARPVERTTITRYRGSIEYLEWSGSRRHPKATEMSLDDVFIEEHGCYYVIFDEKGNEILRKKMGSRGTYVTDYEAEKRYAERRQKEIEEEKKRKEEEDKQYKTNSTEEAYAFYELIKDSNERSRSGHMYPYGRKPSRATYANGLDKFFTIGEHRLLNDYYSKKYILETWNGVEWISELD